MPESEDYKSVFGGGWKSGSNKKVFAKGGKELSRGYLLASEVVDLSLTAITSSQAAHTVVTDQPIALSRIWICTTPAALCQKWM